MSSLASSQPPLRTTSVKRNRDIEESKKEKEAIFVTKVGALTNIALALSKGSVGKSDITPQNYYC
jgi:inosine-uridine nucleoside N-ribohydrolase